MSVRKTLENLRIEFPELNFRALTGERDFNAILSILKDMYAAGIMESPVRMEQIRNDYAHLGSCKLETDSLLIQDGSQALAYTRITHYQSSNGKENRFYGIRGISQAGIKLGLDDVLLDWDEARAREIAAAENPGLLSVLTFGSLEQDKRWQEHLEAHKFKPIRYYVMMSRSLSMPIPEIPLPSGIEIRPYAPGQERQIWDASVEAFQDEWESENVTEEDYQHWLADPEWNPDLFQVAWDGNQVAGTVLAYIDQAYNQENGVLRGYTENISVRRPWRGHGLAKAMICRSMQAFKDLGMQEAALEVDSENPSGALSLYKSLGYSPYRTEIVYRKSLDRCCR